MGYQKTSLPPIDNHEKFEELVKELFKHEWNDINIQLNGRNGQEQFGVDIYGRINGKGLYKGIQCKWKGYNKTLEEGEIKKEIKKASLFPQIDQLIIATTAERDAKIQKFAREYNVSKDKKDFDLVIYSWNEINDLLNKFPDVMRDFYKPETIEIFTPVTKGFENKRYIGDETFEFSSDSVLIIGFRPKFPEYQGVISIRFKSMNINDFSISISHKEVINTLFRGLFSPPLSSLRSHIMFVNEENNEGRITLSSSSFFLPINEIVDFSYLLDEIAKFYVDDAAAIDSVYNTYDFSLNKKGQFRLLMISRPLWRQIISFVYAFDYANGDSKWHIFDQHFNCVKIYCKTYEDKHKDHRLFINAEYAYDDVNYQINNDYVWLTWDPDQHIFYRQNEDSFMYGSVWDAKFAYVWLTTILIPTVLEWDNRKNSSMISKAIDFFLSNEEFNFNISNPIIPYQRIKSNKMNYTEKVTNIRELVVLILEIQSRYSVDTGHYLSIESKKRVFQAILFLLENMVVDTGTFGYINSKLGPCKDVDELKKIIKNRLFNLSPNEVFATAIDYPLRVLYVMLRDGRANKDNSNLLSNINDLLEPLFKEYGFHQSLDRLREM